MYTGNYNGYPNNASAGSPPFNANAPPLVSQNSAMQPGAVSNQMMYSSQPFPMGAQSSGAFAPNPNMMAGVSHAGMPHMPTGNGQIPNYQAPFSNPTYSSGVPAPVPAQMNMPPNYAMGGGMPMAGFPMQHGMTPQQQQQQQHHHMMMQRMQASQTNSNISTPTPQRHFQPQPSQGTPTPINGQMLPQAQFPGQSNAQGPLQGQTNTTQPQSQPQMQTSAQAPIQAQASPINVQTPQTPTFPTQSQGNGANGTSAGSTPVSPGADPRDKERVGIILEINNELLLEAMQIQSTQYIIKKERGNEGNANNGDKKAPEEELLTQDYIQCMRRLQTNLSYLAALADKERKPAQQSQPHPLYLKAPTLNTNVRLRQAQDGSEAKTDAPDREETAKYLAELYKKLQALFPDVDPNKEPGNTRPPGQGPNMNQSGSQTPGHASPVPGKQPTPTPATSAPPHFIAMGAPAS